MIKIKEFTKENNQLLFKYNGVRYKVLEKDICDALADQRFGFVKNNPTEGVIMSAKKEGYSLALQEKKGDILEEVLKFEVEENNFALDTLVTYNESFVEPYNVELKNE